MTDSTGTLTYGPNNLLFPTTSWGTQTVTIVSGANYVLMFTVASSATITGSSGCVFTAVGGSAGSYTKAFKTTGSSCILTLGGSGGVTSPILANVTYETTGRPMDALYCGTTTAAACYGPRFDYSTGVAQGFVVEGTSTNTSVPSQNSTSGWNAFGTTFALTGATTAPDGGTGAFLVNMGTTPSVSHGTYTNSTGTSNQTLVWTASRWYKYTGTGVNGVYIDISYGISGVSTFWTEANIQTCTLTGNHGTTGTGGPLYYNSWAMPGPNGWCRVAVEGRPYGSGTGSSMSFSDCFAGPTPNATSCVTTLTADSSTYYSWGLQTEQSFFPTSYMPNLPGGSITRAADIPIPTGPLLTALEGTKGSVVFKTNSGATANASNASYLLYDATNSVIFLGVNATAHGNTTLGATLATSNTATWGAEGAVSNNDLGLTWGVGKGIIDLNGVTTTDAQTRTPGTSFYIGSNNGSATGAWNGAIASITAYTSQLGAPQ
jgi:hypothetical protein